MDAHSLTEALELKAGATGLELDCGTERHAITLARKAGGTRGAATL